MLPGAGEHPHVRRSALHTPAVRPTFDTLLDRHDRWICAIDCIA